MVTATKNKIDINERFTNCLRSDPEYIAAVQRRDELQKQLKRAEMGYSFGAFEEVCGIDEMHRREQVIESVRKGEPTDDRAVMKPKELAERKIDLLKLALRKQESIIKNLEPELWRNAAKQAIPVLKRDALPTNHPHPRKIQAYLACRKTGYDR